MKNRNILLIEDDETIRFAIKLYLEDEGYIVNEAENGSRALSLIDEHGLPDLVLTDMVMPVMSGWQFSEKFKILYDHLVPIVVMTAAASAEKRAQEINANDWISKPFELSELLKVIKKNIKIS